jgi:hypothetical protein
MAGAFTNHLNVPHAVPAAEGLRARTVCGVKVEEVRADVPFPPTQSLAIPRPGVRKGSAPGRRRLGIDVS